MPNNHYDLAMQDFSGIAEKLVRAEENIRNLDSEIELFFEKSEYPVLPENDYDLLLKAIDYHKNLVVPTRFSVLAGEIIHHLRSCYDHVVWHFSVQSVRNIRKIEFPVFDQTPTNHDQRKQFAGKIEGIVDSNVRSLIEGFQPYNSPDPHNNELWIIHDFDIIDKHQELVICAPTGTTVFPIEMEGVIEGYKREHPDLGPAQISRHFKQYGRTQPNISFRNFGRNEIEPISQGLRKLFNSTSDAMKKFEAL